MKIDGKKLPVKVVKKADWPEGKGDPTEYDMRNKTVNVRDDYDMDKDELGWMRHELAHYEFDRDGHKDDGKEYPENSEEAYAYGEQFAYLRGARGWTDFNDAMRKIGKKKHSKVLKKYWDSASVLESFVPSFSEFAIMESPDEIKLGGLDLHWYDVQAFPFICEVDTNHKKLLKILFGWSGASHYHMFDPDENHREEYVDQDWVDKHGSYPGRVWMDDMVISFWTYPSVELFKQIVSGIEKEKGVRIMGTIENKSGWEIEVVMDDDEISRENDPDLHDFSDYETYRRFKSAHRWNEDDPTYLMPVEEYVGSANFPESEKAEHEASAIDKERMRKIAISKAKEEGRTLEPSGFGSTKTAFDSGMSVKTRSKLSTSESMFVPSFSDFALNESPDTVRFDRTTYLSHTAPDAIPFTCIISDSGDLIELLAGLNSTTHKEMMEFDYDSIPGPAAGTRGGIRRFDGRIWTGKKVISFWEYPDPDTFGQILDALSKVVKQDMRDGWQVEVKMHDGKIDTQYSYELTRGADYSYMIDTAIIPVGDYVESDDYDDDERTDHDKTPMEKEQARLRGERPSANPDFGSSKTAWDSANSISSRMMKSTSESVFVNSFKPGY